MTAKEAKKRVVELNKMIEEAAKMYYDEDSPIMSDFEYDMLMNELKELERRFPELVMKDSLTKKVGGTVKEGFEKVTHEVPLQSLQDVFELEEVYSFDERVKKVAKEENLPVSYVVEAKIDGLSTSLKYLEGKFVEGATRGDGVER